MQVQYRETKTGFECIHMPSIDVNSVQPEPTPRRSQHRKQGSTGSHETDTTRKSVARKSSKISFGIKNKEREKEKEREREKEGKEVKEKELPSRPSGGTILSMTPSSASSSFFHVSSSHTRDADPARPSPITTTTTNAPASIASTSAAATQDVATTSMNDANSTISAGTVPLTPLSPIPYEPAPPRSQSPASSKVLPPIPPDSATVVSMGATLSPLPTGEVNQEMFDMISANSLAVRFEVNIVKVCTSLLVIGVLLTFMFVCRSLGSRYMAFSSEERAVMGGSTIC